METNSSCQQPVSHVSRDVYIQNINKEQNVQLLPNLKDRIIEDSLCVFISASVFLLSGIRLKERVTELLYKELTCSDPDDRVRSLLRYAVQSLPC
jgi:hypothetical protein